MRFAFRKGEQRRYGNPPFTLYAFLTISCISAVILRFPDTTIRSSAARYRTVYRQSSKGSLLSRWFRLRGDLMQLIRNLGTGVKNTLLPLRTGTTHGNNQKRPIGQRKTSSNVLAPDTFSFQGGIIVSLFFFLLFFHLHCWRNQSALLNQGCC